MFHSPIPTKGVARITYHALITPILLLQDGGPLRAVQVQGVLQAVHDRTELPQDQVRKPFLKRMITATAIHASSISSSFNLSDVTSGAQYSVKTKTCQCLGFRRSLSERKNKKKTHQGRKTHHEQERRETRKTEESWMEHVYSVERHFTTYSHSHSQIMSPL